MITPTLNHEQQLWNQGYAVVAGVDEVGRGAWAGPVVTAAAVLPVRCGFDNSSAIMLPPLLRDSKKLSSLQRGKVASQLRELPILYAIGQASVAEINECGIAAATFMAMTRAVNQLSQPVDFLLMDGFPHPDWPTSKQRAVIDGDAYIASIAAASILAKVFRDELMAHLDADFPGYGLAIHKGYGTKQHQQAIAQNGLSPIHRTGFKLKFLQ